MLTRLFFLEHFDSKGIVEEYLHTNKPEGKLNFTIVRFSAYFNNFAGFFKPRRMDKNTFIFDIPMEGAPMDGVEVKQGGECVYGMYCNWNVLDEGYLGLRGYK